jgi:succinate dehydrogenase/fumarate reductase cytochrome b subunit
MFTLRFTGPSRFRPLMSNVSRLKMKLHTLHRTSAIFVGAFACLHVANHLASLAGIPSHIAFMEVARKLYRQPTVEFPLLLCVAFQVSSGLWLVIRGWKQRHGAVAWLQAISGVVLVFFLLVHVGAVLYGRTVLNLDTNFYFAAAGFHVPPNQFFFAPYYFLAVLALFTHMGCAAYWCLHTAPPRTRAVAIVLPMVVGGAVSVLFVLSLAGKLHPVEVPAKYKATYARHDG